MSDADKSQVPDTTETAAPDAAPSVLLTDEGELSDKVRLICRLNADSAW
jgi:hypothetical protein